MPPPARSDAPTALARLMRWLRGEPLLLVMLALTVLLGVLDPRPAGDWIQWLDAPTLASLLALLAVAQGIRASGYVQRLARRMLRHVRSRRALVALLMVLSAVSAMLLTNDVSLFLILPLTLALCEMVELPRLVVVTLVALAVNAGSALSPVGNPQNLLLWRHAGIGMLRFAWAMLPAVAIMAACLAFCIWLLVPGGALQPESPPQRTPIDRRLGRVSLALLAMLLVLLQLGHAWAALALVVAGLGLAGPRALRDLDWVLLASIALMLLGLGHLVELTPVRHLLAQLDWAHPRTVLASGVLLSQAISNVPATVALLHRVPDTLLLAVAVNVGGSGLAIGSLANLIALRLEGSRRIWRVFHMVSVPYLLVVAACVWWLT